MTPSLHARLKCAALASIPGSMKVMTRDPLQLPASPPASLLAEVYGAYARVEELADAGVEVDFVHGCRGLTIVLRDGTGARTLRPSDVFALVE